MTQTANKKCWKELFELLQQHPALWKIKSNEYKNKLKKSQAWDVLLEKFNEIEPDGTLQQLKNKITNFKTCYRRELKLVNSSMKSGAGEDDVHVPTLWYFDDFNFLRDQEVASESISTLDDMDEFREVLSKRPKKNSSCDEKNEFLAKACMHLDSLKEKDEAGEDESEVYAKSWACSYRKSDEEQKIYAKKAIEEILILGQLKQLTINAVNTNTPQPSTFFSPHNRFLPSPATSSSNPSPTPVKIIKFLAYFQVPPEQAEERCFSEQELYEEKHYY